MTNTVFASSLLVLMTLLLTLSLYNLSSEIMLMVTFPLQEELKKKLDKDALDNLSKLEKLQKQCNVKGLASLRVDNVFFSSK